MLDSAERTLPRVGCSMLQLAKNLLIRWLILSYGVIALFGQGLHALPGCCHDCDCGAACCDDDGDCCGAVSDHAEPVHFELSGLATVNRPSGEHHHEHDCANCAICQFQAQGQLTSVAVEVFWTFLRQDYCIDEGRIAFISGR